MPPFDPSLMYKLLESPLTPVVFDKWKNPSVTSVEPGMGYTEGARPYFGGKTYGGEKLSADKQWRVSNPYGLPGDYSAESKLSNRGLATFDITHNSHDGTIDATISFAGKGGLAREGDTTGSALRRLNSVMERTRDFVSRVKPASIRWEAADEGLAKLYDKVLPDMADHLGGTPMKVRGTYIITFPQPASYPLKK